MTRAVIIAALENEISPLVQDWARSQILIGGKPVPCYEREGVIAVAAGIGAKRAEAAARIVSTKFKPQMLISAGLAGALIRSLKVANIVLPNVIVDAESGAEYRCNVGGEVIGGGVLVTASQIAGAADKQALVERFHALIVDMEAAGIAKIAQESGIGFRCVKAISDELEFIMPPLNEFVNSDGTFDTTAYARWVSLRPQYWARTLQLGRNSSRAARELCSWLQQNLRSGLRPAKVVTLNEAEYSKH